MEYQGELIEVKCLEQGKIFTTLEFVYSLEGTNYCSVVFKIYHLIPKIDFKLKLAKTISNNIESIYESKRCLLKSDISFHNQTYNILYKLPATVLPPA